MVVMDGKVVHHEAFTCLHCPITVCALVNAMLSVTLEITFSSVKASIDVVKGNITPCRMQTITAP